MACVTDDRVLVKDQADERQNGIYRVSQGLWARASDFDGSNEVTGGTLVYVASGSNQGLWAVEGVGAISLGVDDIILSQAIPAIVASSIDLMLLSVVA